MQWRIAFIMQITTIKIFTAVMNILTVIGVLWSYIVWLVRIKGGRWNVFWWFFFRKMTARYRYSTLHVWHVITCHCPWYLPLVHKYSGIINDTIFCVFYMVALCPPPASYCLCSPDLVRYRFPVSTPESTWDISSNLKDEMYRFVY